MSEGGAQTLDGKLVSDLLIEQVAERVKGLKAPVCLATVLVGDYAPSRFYVARKSKIAKQAGIQSRMVELPKDITQEALESEVRALADDEGVHGILVQLPLPDHLDSAPVLNSLPAAKDVDGLTRANLGALVRGDEGHVPCTPLGVMHILEHYKTPIKSKTAMVVGRSFLVGLPMVLLLSRKGVDATVTLGHSRTGDLAEVCRRADILIAAVGVANMITPDYVKPGATVIDVGVSYVDGAICGDVEFDAVSAVAGALTPMPGGTGPMTVACLMENTLNAAVMQGVK